MWNKQRKDEVLVDVEDVALGHVTKQRWNDKDDWIWSAEPTHEALVSRELFGTVQGLFGTRRGPTTRTPIKGRRYVLSGLLHCDLCGRRMQGQWTHGHAYYRCKFTDEYPGGDEQHPKNVYVREAAITPGLDEWLGSLFDDEHLDGTCAALAGASEPDPEAEKRDADLRAKIADDDRRIRNYKVLFDDEEIVTLAASWIAEVQRERKDLERQLGRQVPDGEMTTDEVKALVRAPRDIVSVLAEADPVDKSELYDQLGISLHYDPAGSVSVQSHPRVLSGVGGPSRPLATRAIRRSAVLGL